MSKLEFRPTSPEDAGEVSEFLRRIFGMSSGHPVIDPRHLRWKCWEERCDWPGSRGFIMTNQHEIVAHATVVPLFSVAGERRLRMAHLIDWAAESKSVGSGVALLKRIGQLVDAIMIAGGSDMTQKILPALGFKPCGQVDRFARPLRPLRRLKGAKLAWRLYAQSARAAFWKLRAPSGNTAGWEVRRVREDELAATAIPWPGPEPGTMLFERTPETMGYFLRCPAAAMELYVAAKDGADRGYFMLAFAPAQARIVDLWTDSGDRRDWRAVVRLAVRAAERNADAAEVVSTASDPVRRQAFLECGFHLRGSVPLRILASGRTELPGLPVSFGMLDSDAAYLHNGEEDLWA